MRALAAASVQGQRGPVRRQRFEQGWSLNTPAIVLGLPCGGGERCCLGSPRARSDVEACGTGGGHALEGDLATERAAGSGLTLTCPL